MKIQFNSPENYKLALTVLNERGLLEHAALMGSNRTIRFFVEREFLAAVRVTSELIFQN